MIDQALDLVDSRGVPKDDPRIRRLEGQCGEKSAARYELQGGICDLCSRSITAVGMEAWLAAKEMRDLDEESRSYVKMGIHEAAAREPRKPLVNLDYSGKAGLFGDNNGDYDGDSTSSVRTAKAVSLRPGQYLTRFLRDDVIDGFASSSAQAGKATVLQPGDDVIDFLENKKHAGNPRNLGLASAAVFATREDLKNFYDDDENIYDADDDYEPLEVIDEADARVSRSGAPSPSYGLRNTDGGLGI